MCIIIKNYVNITGVACGFMPPSVMSYRKPGLPSCFFYLWFKRIRQICQKHNVINYGAQKSVCHHVFERGGKAPRV